MLALYLAAFLASSREPLLPHAQTQAGVEIDAGYTAKIREYTTEPFFLTELVDYLPASKSVPTPEKVLGYVIGTPKVLTYSADCARYLRALEAASPRVRVVSMGRSEEGREMVVALISDEANLRRITRLREINATLGDPRKVTSDAQAETLIAEGVPFYWATGGMHSPETGPPEMILELAYRLAVDESSFIREIRKNSVVMLTPVLEVDGRDRVVDLNRWRNDNPGQQPPPLVYWGKYVAHDNNRDAVVLSLELSKAIMRGWFQFMPLVFHDLHESVPYLYISTGTGPYNAWLDPITVNEWQMLAYNEINELTKRGVPGVWTHDFFDGWAPHYGFYAANGHNGIGRFYETFGGGWADTGIRSVGSQTQRAWFRPNPPFPQVRWSLRNNTNLMQSGLLLGLHKVATEKNLFLRNYYLKAKRSVAKARTEGPAAYVLRHDPSKPGTSQMLLALLRRQGIEIHRLAEGGKTSDGEFAAGDFVIRMDQPYSRMADMLLDTQYYNPNDPRSYDDTGWTLGPQFNLEVVRCKDLAVLDWKMALLQEAEGPTHVEGDGVFAIRPTADFSLAQLVYSNPRTEFRMLDRPLSGGESTFPAGSVFFSPRGGRVVIPGLPAEALPTGSAMPEGTPLHAPRIALVHTWSSTQDEGWARLAFDQMGIPYSYISVHEIRDRPNLRENFDVVIFPQTRGTAQSIVNGIRSESPIPWRSTELYPNLGGPDESEDIRGGIELEGVLHLKRFVEEGGLLITVGSTCRIPIDYGLVTGVTVQDRGALNAPGGVYLAENVAPSSPALTGLGTTMGAYFNANSCVILSLGGGGGGPRSGGGPQGRASGRGSLTDPDVIQGRPPYRPQTDPGDAQEGRASRAPGPAPKVLLRFADAQRLLISGMIDDATQLERRALVVQSPLGRGNILMFGGNPFWRCQTVGSYGVVLNAALNYSRLRRDFETAPSPPQPADGG